MSLKNLNKKKYYSKKKFSSKKGGKTIYATNIYQSGKNKGKKSRRKNIAIGKCEFPFKYNNKYYSECIDSKLGKWCAVTKINEGKKKDYTNTFGYCLIEPESISKKKKIISLDEDISLKTKNSNEIITNKIKFDGKIFLLEKKNKINIYTLPDKKGNFFYIGRLLPNEMIDFDAPEYIENNKIIS